MPDKKEQPVRRATARRISVRISIDESMGDLYQWLLAIPPAVRSRELLSLARLGHAINSGVFRLAQPAGAAAVQSRSALTGQSASVGAAMATGATGQLPAGFDEFFSDKPPH